MTLENIVTQLTKDAVKALYNIDCTDAQVQLQKPAQSLKETSH